MITSSGLVTCRNVNPGSPGCLPGARSVDSRRERGGGLTGPSEDGGFDDTREFFRCAASSSATRRVSTSIRASRSPSAASNRASRSSSSTMDGESDTRVRMHQNQTQDQINSGQEPAEWLHPSSRPANSQVLPAKPSTSSNMINLSYPALWALAKVMTAFFQRHRGKEIGTAPALPQAERAGAAVVLPIRHRLHIDVFASVVGCWDELSHLGGDSPCGVVVCYPESPAATVTG